MEAGQVDKGYAWLVCFVSFINCILLGGLAYTPGMFFIMFKEALSASDWTLTLITSLNLGTYLSIGPLAGKLSEKFGRRKVALCGSFLSTAGLASSAFATQIFHLYILYGVVAGCGMGLVICSSISILDSYFLKHRRTAISLSLAGAGVGSIMMPPVLKALENSFAWRGAILLMAGLNAQGIVMSALYRPNEHPQSTHKFTTADCEIVTVAEKRTENQCNTIIIANRDNQVAKQLCREKDPACTIKSTNVSDYTNRSNYLKLCNNVPYVGLCFYALMSNFASSTVYTHLGNYALSIGFSSTHVVELYMAMGISSTISRLLTGIISQASKANIAFLMLSFTVVLGVVTIAFPLTTQLWCLFVYVVLFEVCTAPYNVLNGSLVMESVSKENLDVAYGVTLFFCTPGQILSPPFAAWLYHFTDMYGSAFIMAGTFLLLAGLSMLPAYIQNRRQRSIL